MTRSLSCPCGANLVGADEDEIVTLTQAHLAEAHPGREYSREMILMMVV